MHNLVLLEDLKNARVVFSNVQENKSRNNFLKKKTAVTIKILKFKFTSKMGSSNFKHGQSFWDKQK